MINELFEKLPTEIAFMILTYQPHQTAVIINDYFKQERMSDIVEELSYRFKDASWHVKTYFGSDVIDDGDFYGYYFDVSIQYIIDYEGFYIMPESSKPPKILVPRTRFLI